jgi:hypothetical protein
MSTIQQYSILLYSQYSPNSQKLIELVKHSIPSEFGLTEICIDNDKIRKQIYKSKKIEVKIVPCILVIFSDGVVEKYDGSNAFRWVEEIASKLTPPPPPVTVSQQPQQFHVSTEPVTNLIDDEDDFIPQPPSPKRKQKLRQTAVQNRQLSETNGRSNTRSKINPALSRQSATLPIASTSVDEIETDEDDHIDDYSIRKPIKVMRSDAGNYDLEVDFGGNEPESPKREIKRGIKTNGSQLGQKSQSDLITQAQKMQKLREIEDDELHPHKMASSDS